MSEVESGDVIRRTFPAELLPSGDGRTLDLRVIPYNTIARVKDPGGPAYEEEWLPGAFDKQLNAANRVLVNFEHEQGFSNVVGRGAAFADSPAALDLTARVLQGPDGDKALELVNEGVLTGVSLEAIPLKSIRTADGVVQRVKARLVNIALCRFPAFDGAGVLAVREAPEGDLDPDPTPDPPPEGDPPSDPEPDPAPDAAPAEPSSEVDRALARVGVAPLEKRTITDQLWDRDSERFTDEEWEASCLIDRGNDTPAKSRFGLPVYEPSGELNREALREASAILSGQRSYLSNVTTSQKAEAARKLARLYRQADMPLTDTIRQLMAR